jgi:hypothetical protein
VVRICNCLILLHALVFSGVFGYFVVSYRCQLCRDCYAFPIVGSVIKLRAGSALELGLWIGQFDGVS